MGRVPRGVGRDLEDRVGGARPPVPANVVVAAGMVPSRELAWATIAGGSVLSWPTRQACPAPAAASAGVGHAAHRRAVQQQRAGASLLDALIRLLSRANTAAGNSSGVI